MNNRDFRTAIRNQAFGVPIALSNNLSGGQLRKREGGCVAPAGGPNESSAAIAILRRGDCDSNGPATLQTLNPHTAQLLDSCERDRQQDQRDAEARAWNEQAQLQRETDQ